VDLGGVWVTYLEINFELGSNAPHARLGKIPKFQPVQTSNLCTINPYKTDMMLEEEICATGK
jgi:hypothetical protein